MRRRLFLLLLVLALCLSMCACKTGKEKPADDDFSSSENSGNEVNNDQGSGDDAADNQQDNGQNQQNQQNQQDQQGQQDQQDDSDKNEDDKPVTPPVSDLAVADWQVEQPAYLSYEEYFAVEREFGDNLFHSSDKWIKGDQVYHFQWDMKDHFEVKCYEPTGKYAIPNSGEYRSYYTPGADGRYGYLYNDSQFLRMDLATGKTEVLLTGSSLGIRLVDNLVLYYRSYDNNELTIGRLYLPTLKNDILYKTQGEFYGLALHTPKTNKSSLVWELWNPEFIDFLKAELANPNSKIQKGEHYDFSEVWEREDAFSFILTSPMHLHYLQDAGNQRALMKCTYNLETKQLTQQTGIMDNCWHGSGYPHDHYNTEITTVPAPELIVSDWTKVAQETPFSLCLPEDSEMARGKAEKLTGVDSQIYLYAKTDGDYKKIVDSPIKRAVDTGSCAIYLTANGESVIAVSYDGTQSVELYHAVHGTICDIDLGLGKTRLLLRDGDTLVAIDLSMVQYREVLKNQYLCEWYFDSSFKDGQSFDTDKIYFVLRAGMCFEAYIVDVKTGELKEAGYRL